MKKDIILAGVGGQGILSIATVIGRAAVANGMYLKQAEVHGMSQRGGDVQSHLRISTEPICSDLIPEGKADLIISVEPMESLRYLPMLNADGWVITNNVPFKNVPDYPSDADLEKAMKSVKNMIAFNADQLAREIGSPRSANMVILGAAADKLGLPYEEFEKAVAAIFAAKGEDIVSANLKAMASGREQSQK
ncbi:MAG: indolepyruvate oxidoreductase subunit beta [Bacteroidales bacterium]|nr:indolepyruvate oxidoreductase subunit beta [Bacteroidales bacterium]MDE7101455.1 indolepyruvate oxidoreductase subunit beta [Bacteroidales bacterium]MDE7337800.1 indolepyruvate oxidoreductase subunit beta [Bacteroidales bacterium]